MKTKIIVIVGPTAVGKTALAIEVAKRFNGEVVSGDSQQVYRGLDIGTAKASPEEQAAVPHHLIDVREITESYSAFDFVSEAKMTIEDIHSRGKLAIIAGGTGLYIQSLLEGYHLGGETPHEEILAYRASLEPYSDEELAHLVEQAALEIPQFNRRRAMRALEIAHFGRIWKIKRFCMNR
ncbi:IPP transferase family protein [Streptococcus pneumoniae 2070335]|nr:IPP transferase family protein [Streptococcus pneumoniae 2070335]